MFVLDSDRDCFDLEQGNARYFVGDLRVNKVFLHEEKWSNLSEVT